MRDPDWDRFHSTRLEDQLRGLRSGDHACVVSDDVNDALASASVVIRAGLDDGERCLYLASGGLEDAARRLASHGIDVARARESGALKLRAMPKVESSVAFDVDAIMAVIEHELSQAWASGFPAVRIVSEMSWAVPSGWTFEELRRLEALEQRLTEREPLLFLCLRDGTRNSPAARDDALTTHPIAITEDEVCVSPYFEPAELMQEDRERAARLKWRLHLMQHACAAERKRGELEAERKFRRAAERSREQVEVERARLQAILQHAPSGIAFYDAESGMLEVNPRAKELLGLDIVAERGREQLVGIVCAPSGEPLPLDELPSSRALRGEAVEDEELLLVRDGIRVPVQVAASRLELKKRRYAIVVFHDITPMKELQRLREEWNLVIAHDLRQPVSVIASSSELLARGTGDEAAIPLQHIRSSVQRLKQMIEDLLYVSRFEAERFALHRSRFDLSKLVVDAVDRLQVASPGLRLRLQTPSRRAFVNADWVRVEQALVNLLQNAAKYSRPGSEIRVEVSARPHDVEVAVSNEGTGIAPDELPLLFDKFYRTSDARAGTTPGVGLGLYISKSIVKAHGGRIHAESVPGGTTTFRFTLPAATERSV